MPLYLFYLNCKLLKSKSLSFYSKPHSHLKGLEKHLDGDLSAKLTHVSEKYFLSLHLPLSFFISSSDFCFCF